MWPPNCFNPYDVNPINNEKYCNHYASTKTFTYQLGPVYMIPVHRDLGLLIIYCYFCSCVYMEAGRPG